ncbi:MAG TPA: hypothetical protein PLQ69_04875 [Paludibacter sp.]|jgi:hypothetical protein|nr:hypothetical protein [Paludibacter sp.]HPM10229.1 hypothetical protein [Paludibacter sp.]
MNRINVSFLLWGGSQNLDIKLTHAHVSEGELLFMLEWAKKWSDNIQFSNFIENGGLSWLDTPIPDSQYRLHLRPYFSRTGSDRPSMYFLGLFVPKSEMVVFGNYANLIASFHLLSLDMVKNAQGDMLTVKKKVAALHDEENSIDEWQNIDGLVLRGDYEKLFSSVRSYFNMEASSPSMQDNLVIACNPPKPDDAFSTILITRDFYYQGMKIVKPKPPVQPAPQNPESYPTSEFADEMPVSPQKNFSIKTAIVAVSIMMLAGSFVLWHKGLIPYGRQNINDLPNLVEFLQKAPTDINEITLSFKQIEMITGEKILKNHKDTDWWKNKNKAWSEVGFTVSEIDKAKEWIKFSRTR